MDPHTLISEAMSKGLLVRVVGRELHLRAVAGKEHLGDLPDRLRHAEAEVVAALSGPWPAAEGYWIRCSAGGYRTKAYRIVDDCRRVAGIVRDRMGAEIDVPNAIASEVDIAAFKERLASLPDDILRNHLKTLRNDFSESSINFLPPTVLDRLALTAVAGELAAQSGVVPWRREYASIAVVDYAETIDHMTRVLAREGGRAS